jgi:hypothetical protein
MSTVFLQTRKPIKRVERYSLIYASYIPISSEHHSRLIVYRYSQFVLYYRHVMITLLPRLPSPE